MDPATLARVLEPFFTTKPPGVGTGLGMAMVYGLVKQHNGFVHLYSEPGQGTTVKLYLPLVYVEAEQPTQASALESLPGGSESILVVEDDPALRTVAERLFTKHGYRVFAAADGAEGLELYRVHGSEIALVVTDLIMPKAGGFDVYEGVRRGSCTTKVLFTSGYPTPNYKNSVAGDANVAFLTKPWTVSDMLAQVRALLDRPATGPG
jgi:CheY-like chemotaxis protein